MRKLLLLLVIGLMACNPSLQDSQTDTDAPIGEPDLAGVWKVEEVTIEIPEMEERMADATRDLLLSTTTYLAADSSFKRYDDYLPTGITGTWWRNNRTNELYYNFNLEGIEQDEIYTIETLTDKRMVLKQDVFKGVVRLEMKRIKV